MLEKPAVFAKIAGFCIHKIEREKKSMCYKMSKNVRGKDQKRALYGWIKNIY